MPAAMSLDSPPTPDADAPLDAGPCPVRDVLDRIGDRWSMLVLLTLNEAGTLRFTALKARMADVSQRMLAQTLRQLQQDGLVSRTAYSTVPPRVDYALTPLGQSIMVPLLALAQWAVDHHGDLLRARAAHQAAQPLE